ncbi:MAG: hypothetical protein N2376_06265 [Clostridia bacterium]|nr:hypothetical protein [Clostridia bacterium]
MAVFFTCIILIGSGITVFALLLMLAEKRRLHDYRTDLKEKKDDLIKVIEDAEELISEMNRFSDYVVTQIEEKNNSLAQTISEADLRIELLSSPQMFERPVSQSATFYDEAAISRILEEEKLAPIEAAASSEAYQAPVRKGKVLTFDLKRREIMNLAKKGLDSTEIAKLLNCGKGEIELIARMGR